MGDWVIDSYGLRAAHSRSVLDGLQDTDRLHVSPLTWQPTGTTCTSSYAESISSPDSDVGHLALVDADNSSARSRTASLTMQLQDLHGRGVLVLVSDHECDPEHVANVEASWKPAGLVGRPTDETLTAVITADRLSIDLITNDSDVRKLADYWQVQALTITDFASALAA
jgi:hypothetical protein